MNFQRGREREPLEINLVPLIDVMMVILIFLMITTTYNRYTELAINLPSADAQKQPERRASTIGSSPTSAACEAMVAAHGAPPAPP